MRNPVDAPIDPARLFGTPESPDGVFWLTRDGDKIVAIADGVIVATGVDPATSDGYVVQKLPDGNYFSYLGLAPDSISVLAQVGVAEGASLGTILSGVNLEGILSDSADGWLGQGNLQDPKQYLVNNGVVQGPEPAPAVITFAETPAAVVPVSPEEVSDAEPVVVDAAPPAVEPVPVTTEAPTDDVPVETPVFPEDAVSAPSTDDWALSTIPEKAPDAVVTPPSLYVPPQAVPQSFVSGGSVLSTVTAPIVPVTQSAPASFDYIVTSNPLKGTPVATADPNTVEVLPLKGGVIGAITSLPFWNDLATRAINTFLQVGGGALGTGALGITHLSYKNALELGAASAVLSIITSLTRATSIKSN